MRLTSIHVGHLIALVFAVLGALPEARGQATKPATDKEKEPAKTKTATSLEAAKIVAPAAVLSLFPQGYPGYEALTASLQKLAAINPERVRVSSLAKSSGGRDVWLVQVGKASAYKPALLVVANIEADHVVGSLVALNLAERLAELDAKGAAWLDRTTIYIVPRLNPDGAERAIGAPLTEFRTNLRPIDRDRDGKLGEDGPDDLNGDGVVGLMRVKDPKTATLVVDDKDPRILRKADALKGEKAVYAEELEGRDDDNDGLRNEDAPGGVNLNRNWPHRWSELTPETGFSPASEPEVFSLISWAFAHPEIAAVWTFSLNDNLREEPKKPASTLAEADLPMFAELSRLYLKTITAKDSPKGSSPAGKGTSAPGATTDGALNEWAYYQFGALGLASRLWTTPEIPAPPEDLAQAAKAADKEKEKAKEEVKAKVKDVEKKDAEKKEKPPTIPEESEQRWLYWNDHVMGGRAFLPFVAVEHPTLGKVEVGGWRPGVRLNPPVEQAGAIAESHFAFLKDLAGKTAALAVPELKVASKGGGLFEVTAVVANDGFLPTALDQGVRDLKAPPVLVRLLAGKAKILAGRPLERIDTLAGSGGRREFRWLIQAPEGVASVQLDVSCPRAGRLEKTIELK